MALHSRIRRIPEPRARQAYLLLGGAVALSIAVVIPLPILHSALALPLALILPGYALLLALFGGAADLDLAPALALSLLLSLACLTLLSLALDGMAIPLSQRSVLIGVDVLLLALLAVIEARARQVRPSSAHSFAPSGQLVPIPRARRLPQRIAMAGGALTAWPRMPGIWWGASLLAALAVTICTLAVVLPRLPRTVDVPFTQFYLAGSWSHLDGTVQTHGAQSLTVPVGVTNHTHQTHAYRIVGLLDQRAGWAVSSFTLGTGRAWLGSARGAIPRDGCLHQITLRLLTEPGGGVVASLNLWIQGAGGPRTACATRHD